jgi:hypothetical protein
MPRLALLLAVLTSSTAFAATENNAVAVLDIQGTGVSADLLPTLTEVLTVEIAELGYYKVIAGRDIQSMLGFEKQKDVMGCTDASCLAEIGGALGVDRIVASHIGMVGSTYVVNIKLINIRMADTEARVYETVRGEVDALIATIKKSVQKLLGSGSKAALAIGAKLPPPAVTASAPATTASTSSSAAGSATSSAPAEGTNVAAVEPAAHAEARGSGGGKRIGVGSIVLWGVGAVGLAAGAALGSKAKSEASRSWEKAPGTDMFSVGSQKAAEDAPKLAMGANVAFGVGSLAVAGGLVLWLLSGSSSHATALAPTVSGDTLGLAVTGAF